MYTNIRYTCGTVSGTLYVMNIVLLGIGIGLVSLLAPGPVNLTLVQYGARKGPQPALRGAVGVVGADSMLGLTWYSSWVPAQPYLRAFFQRPNSSLQDC